MLPVMVDLVVDAARKPNRRGEVMTHLIDCYCGSGLFCLGSAKHFDVCVGIEVNDLAVQEAEGNAELNGITNCKFVSASAEAIFESEDPVVVQQDEGETSILVRDTIRQWSSTLQGRVVQKNFLSSSMPLDRPELCT